jgi:hypothetical protein
MAVEIVEVIGTKKAYKPSRTKFGFPLKLGAVNIRLSGDSGGGPRIERFAFPLFNYLQIPLVGEHIAVIKGPTDLKNPGTLSTIYYYLGPIQIHGNNHLNPMPGAFDVTALGGGVVGAAAAAGPAIYRKATYKPGENYKETKSIQKLQPYEGDVIIEGRNGQALRLGSSMKGSTGHYAEKQFYKGKQNAPITILSNGINKSSAASSVSVGIGKLKKAFSQQTYTIEDPDDTDSIFILSSKHKIDMKLAHGQQKYGEGVEKMNMYSKPQIIGSSERIVLNAKKDEIVLIGKKDVKVVTPKWTTDMEEFFNQVLDFMEEVINQNKELEKCFKELGSVAQANASSIHPTGVGPSGPPTNAGSFIKSKGKASKGASKTNSLRKKLEKIKNKVEKMKG